VPARQFDRIKQEGRQLAYTATNFTKGENLGQMWYPVKARHNKHNLSAGTDTVIYLSPFTSQLPAIKILNFARGTIPMLEGRGGVKGLVVVLRESPP